MNEKEMFESLRQYDISVLNGRIDALRTCEDIETYMCTINSIVTLCSKMYDKTIDMRDLFREIQKFSHD